MNIKSSGKIVIVAGGTSSLGSEISLAFLRRSATTVVTYRKEEFLALEESAGSNQPLLEGHMADVTSDSGAAALVV